ncbi:MAG: biotin--[acetyl-CoA-carboxylase] ligase [Deltaproteobacteria bacterium]
MNLCGHEALRLDLAGHEVLHLVEVDSTNSWLLAREDLLARDGLVVAADRQTHGRGKGGRVWEQGAGGHLFASVVVHAGFLGKNLSSLTLLVGLAVARALIGLHVPDVRLKWPNDVFVKGKKTCGILCESRDIGHGRVVVAGIGVNIAGRIDQFPPDICKKAGTLESLTGRPWDRWKVLEGVLRELDEIREEVKRHGLISLLCEWERHSSSLGAEVAFEGGVGRVVGLDPSGRLLAELPDGRIMTVVSGNIQG